MAADCVGLDPESGGYKVGGLVSVEFPKHILAAVPKADCDEILDGIRANILARVIIG
jgi:hypothetical protein